MRTDYKNLLMEGRGRFLGENTVLKVEWESITVDIDIVVEATNKLKTRKAPSLGEIHAELVKNGTDTLLRMTKEIINKCIKEAGTPGGWKTGFMSLMIKKGDRGINQDELRDLDFKIINDYFIKIIIKYYIIKYY